MLAIDRVAQVGGKLEAADQRRLAGVDALTRQESSDPVDRHQELKAHRDEPGQDGAGKSSRPFFLDAIRLRSIC